MPIFHGLCLCDERPRAVGHIKLDDRQRLVKHLQALNGQRVEVIVRPERSKRSIKQNKWLFGCALPLLAECLGYDKHEHEDLHYAMVAKCYGTHYDEKLGLDVPNRRSSKLTTREFSDYMEWFVRFAATEFGCVIPLPNEVDLSAYEDEDSAA